MDPRRRIPSVDALLDSPAFDRLLGANARSRVASALRSVQADVRERLGDSRTSSDAARTADPDWYADAVAGRLAAAERRSLRRVINGTGVVLHTNLGRAPLADVAREAIAEAAGYTTLEYDLDTGGRGSRHDHCVTLLRELTGAEAALVVNNNAAAVVLALNTLADRREAVISRGELVEIGGSFRVPEIMARSGARMREVGATNRTHAADYRAALGQATGAILKVHRSNFRLEGFTAEVDVAELAGIAAEREVPLVVDQGSGLLLDLAPFGLPEESTAGAVIRAGADIVTMSGDKLLGGPQAGLIVGREPLVSRMRANPLARALRPDKLTLAALEATLSVYRDPDRARREIPVLRMLAAGEADLAARAGRLAERLRAAGVESVVDRSASTVGGGAYPGVELPSRAVAIDPGQGGADPLAARLRQGEPSVIGVMRDGRLLLDLRTIAPEEEEAVAGAVLRATTGG